MHRCYLLSLEHSALIYILSLHWLDLPTPAAINAMAERAAARSERIAATVAATMVHPPTSLRAEASQQNPSDNGPSQADEQAPAAGSRRAPETSSSEPVHTESQPASASTDMTLADTTPHDDSSAQDAHVSPAQPASTAGEPDVLKEEPEGSASAAVPHMTATVDALNDPNDHNASDKSEDADSDEEVCAPRAHRDATFTRKHRRSHA